MDGIINVCKPAGITSRQITSIVKRVTHTKKVGHAGTLDPGAAGVLPILLGKATRLFDILGEDTKEYIGEFHFGIATDTQDSYGLETARDEKVVTRKQLEAVLPEFLGKIQQQPSKYSAIHINGKRAYDYAFSGEEVELPTRQVAIFELELLHQTGENTFLVRVLCSKGTYIRSLCVDIAKALGTIGYLSFLLRTKTSRFGIENSVTLDELESFEEDQVIKLEDSLAFLPSLVVREEYKIALYNGNKLPLDCTWQEVKYDTWYAVRDSNNDLCGIGRRDEELLRIKINLRERL